MCASHDDAVWAEITDMTPTQPVYRLNRGSKQTLKVLAPVTVS
jgi:hypothetical protein